MARFSEEGLLNTECAFWLLPEKFLILRKTQGDIKIYVYRSSRYCQIFNKIEYSRNILEKIPKCNIKLKSFQ